MKIWIDLIKFFTKHTAIRFIISGGTSAVVDLTLLYIFNVTWGIHYLLAAILAFLCAFFVSFTLHKFWTFKSHEVKTRKQVVLYFAASLFGLFLNTLFMYIFVDYFLMHVIVAQILTGGIVAFSSFFISRRYVFKRAALVQL
jgi:putative flippase GtrA